jgi:hypothetical protein
MKGSDDRRMHDAFHVLNAPAAVQKPVELTQLRDQGNALFDSGQFVRAARIYGIGYEMAKSNGDLRAAVRFLN